MSDKFNTERNATESTKYPGFFIAPGYRDILVSEDGVVIYKKNGKAVTQHNQKGYRSIWTYCRDRRRMANVFVQRIMAYTFKVKANSKQDQANHKDKVRDNNHKDNIEWTTCKENVRHARANKLNSTGNINGVA